mmetsp:Transcript_26578/g.80335  ORF Transcript_26578/g.80335 Transcript_26578/m.80335 type:complete len:208 (+) Transcript_26578:197-820(+)
MHLVPLLLQPADRLRERPRRAPPALVGALRVAGHVQPVHNHHRPTLAAAVAAASRRGHFCAAAPVADAGEPAQLRDQRLVEGARVAQHFGEPPLRVLQRVARRRIVPVAVVPVAVSVGPDLRALAAHRAGVVLDAVVNAAVPQRALRIPCARQLGLLDHQPAALCLQPCPRLLHIAVALRAAAAAGEHELRGERGLEGGEVHDGHAV